MAKKTGYRRKEGIADEMILLLPLLFLLTIYLFCVRAKIVDNSYFGTFWLGGGEQTGDIYGYFRMQLFVGITLLFTAYMLFCIFTGRLKVNRHKAYIPMAVYAVFVVVSYLFSEQKAVALWGANSRYEGTIPLLCYMLLLFYTIQAVRSEKAVSLVVKCFGGACFVLGIWGILQTMGFRLTDLPAWLYVPANLRGASDISLAMDTNTVNWFFSNQNYTAFFLIFPVCLFGMACIAAEERKKRICYAVLTGLMLFCLWQAASLGGMVGLAVSFLMALCIAGRNIGKWKKSLGLLLLAGVLSIGASLPVILQEVKSAARTDGSAGADTQGLRFAAIDDIVTDGEDIVFFFEGEEVRIVTEHGKVAAVTGTAQDCLQVSSYIDEKTGYHIVAVDTANNTWIFIAEGGSTYFVTPTGQGIPLHRTERLGFENHQGFATNRGYIWSRTLPLLQDTIVYGKGADTFALYFPQDDYAGKYNIGVFSNTQNTVVDKPHNMYLGTAVQTGCISLLALLAIYALYLAESVRLYHKHTYEGFADYIGMGIFIAIAGYLVAGLVNDSTVQMMPEVYVFLGMGFAVNRLLKKRTAEKE